MRNLTIPATFLFLFAFSVTAVAGDHTGQFETTLVANVEDKDRVILKQDDGARLQGVGPFPAGTHFAAGKLLDPRTEQFSLFAYLSEEDDIAEPVLYVDVNADRKITADERFKLTQPDEDNERLWEATVLLPISEGIFKLCPIYVQYLRNTVTDKMIESDRLLLQSTEVLARGKIDVKGKPVLVQYAYSIRRNEVTPQEGWMGVDTDENGTIDMDGLSPEAAKADDESVVFRAGSVYVSTKKADISKNQIVLREHSAKDYKRLELYLNKEFPEFTFTDFDGKKRRFSEFRGKYVLLDVWGFWCPPCQLELPYIREANRRFAARNFAVVGLNTDPDYTVESMKSSLKRNDMAWTQGQFESVVDFLSKGLRVNSFPTTFLISPEGKILSMSRSDRNEPDLRQQGLLKSLNKILPKAEAEN